MCGGGVVEEWGGGLIYDQMIVIDLWEYEYESLSIFWLFCICFNCVVVFFYFLLH